MAPPPDFVRGLKRSSEAWQAWMCASDAQQREQVAVIEEARSGETRPPRIAHAIELLRKRVRNCAAASRRHSGQDARREDVCIKKC